MVTMIIMATTTIEVAVKEEKVVKVGRPII